LKAKKDAYDGRGNARINQPEDIAPAREKLGERELYVEKCLDLDKEIGLMIARNERGEIVTHPVVEMIHARDICQVVLAPAPIDSSLQLEAQDIARRVLGYLAASASLASSFSLILRARSGSTRSRLVHIILAIIRLRPARHHSSLSSCVPLPISLWLQRICSIRRLR
ncbi:MAG: ATP-grasp domain-containing protein, partial [Ktedonobacteraceae bacterium]|nr:ATP-grasp domain-containing protein [Ktedonobacteraceae bacterium]